MLNEVMKDGLRWLVVWGTGFAVIAFAVFDLKFFIHERRNTVLNRELIKFVGARCRTFRQSIGLKQEVVAKETGYSVETVSGFENGRNNNASILLWYIAHGMEFERGDHLEN